ncbi:hypothetical protein L484_006949 [Morus notabilis]|uniref:Uncharacterized protein n=1 Tax=Morus notabilis TaxID=981085 RepID=W9QSN7_9ROSA|nr:hypothetical protein L484_006949 [Morus notabilis]
MLNGDATKRNQRLSSVRSSTLGSFASHSRTRSSSPLLSLHTRSELRREAKLWGCLIAWVGSRGLVAPEEVITDGGRCSKGLGSRVEGSRTWASLKMAPTMRSKQKPQRVLGQSEDKKTTSMDMFTSDSSFIESCNNIVHDHEDFAVSGCSTPKAERYKIPELLSCPPPPKKRKVAPSFSSNRSPIAFFAPPDLGLFFFFAFLNSC